MREYLLYLEMNALCVRNAVKSLRCQEMERKRNLGSVTDQELASYEKIKILLPELNSYKRSTVLYFQDLAEKNGFDNLEDYFDYLQREPGAVNELKTNLTLQDTQFFRGSDWPYLLEKCLPVLAERDKIRVWCAGCAGGNEVYSILLALRDVVPLERVDLLASDYNEAMLESCRNGEYSIGFLKQIPRRYWCCVEPGRGLHRHRFTFTEELKSRIRTENVNLLTDEYPKGFDLLLCRNVIKFFSPEAIAETQKKLAASVAPGGFLFLSVDGENNYKELIPHPEELGLRQEGERPIYRKEEKAGPKP